MRIDDNDINEAWDIRMDFQVLELDGKFWITLTWCPECGHYVDDPQVCHKCGYHFDPINNEFECKKDALDFCTWFSMCELQVRIAKKGEACAPGQHP